MRFRKLDEDNKYLVIILVEVGLYRMGWSDRIFQVFIYIDIFDGD